MSAAALLECSQRATRARQAVEGITLPGQPDPVNTAVFMNTVKEALIEMAGNVEATVTAAMSIQPATFQNNRPLSELKFIANLKPLTSDKLVFREWNDKFINALVQGLGPEWRTFFVSLNAKLAAERKPVTMEALNQINGANRLDAKKIENDDNEFRNKV